MTEATPLASEQITRIALEDVTPSIAAAFADDTCLIWSGEWQAYWREAGNGYTKSATEAGLFTIEAAYARTRHCGPEKQIAFERAALSASPALSGQAEDHSSLRYEIRWSRPGEAEELVCSDLTMRVCFSRIMQAARHNGGVMVHAIVPSAPSGQGVSGEVPEGMTLREWIARTVAVRCARRPWVQMPADFDKRAMMKSHGICPPVTDDEMTTDDAFRVADDILQFCLAAPAPSCAPGEVGAILARLPAAPWRVTPSLLADFGASLEVDNDSNFGNIGHIRDYDTACALADLVREAATFTASNKTANMDAVISILKRHWPATPFMHKNCANAILAALSPQRLDAKEGERLSRIKALSEHILAEMRRIARQDGWALAVHGSMTRDLDVVAVPWTDEASDETAFVEAMRAAVARELGGVAVIGAGEDGRTRGVKAKPHGRRCWTIHSTSEQLVEDEHGAHPYVDLSVLDLRTTPSQRLDAATVERCVEAAEAEKVEAEVTQHKEDFTYNRGISDAIAAIRALATEPHQHGGKA